MPKTNVYSVSRINSYIAGLLNEDFFLKKLSVRGEVSSINRYDKSPSGHIYFQLKDEKSSIMVKMWRSKRASGLNFPIKDGDAVIVSGQIRVYEDNGTYYLQADKIQKEGAGELAARFEELKRSLQEMGMFDAKYKKAIPKYAKTVGIVTAPSGAAIRDIIRTAKNKNPFVKLILSPAKVQGEGAAEEIAEAILRLDEIGCDVMIVGRGGGSMEDLWAFNEEVVARAIFACQTPVISAVGHEVDNTISDLVADHRAATPTAGAEAAVFDVREYLGSLDEYRLALDRRMMMHTDKYRTKYDTLKHRLLLQSPKAKVIRYRDRIVSDEQRLEAHSPMRIIDDRRKTSIELMRRLESAMDRTIHDARMKHGIYNEKLEGASPGKRFAGGYSYVKGKDGRKLTGSKDIKVGDQISVYMPQGRVDADVSATYDDWGI